MIFLSKEDKETWEKYKLNMHKLRIDIKKIETNSYNKNLNQSFQKKSNTNYILNNTFGKFLKLLNKKRIEPDGIIDLHGFNLKEAKLRLKNYVFQAFNSNKRNILIITGKGKPKAEWDLNLDYRGVLRNEVPVWLEEAPLAGLILSVKKANSKHGGGGALYVYLRKNKSTIN